MRRISLHRTKGFTLIELLVVIAIIGLLSMLAIVALSNARQRARDARRLGDVKQFQLALEQYFNENNNYPTGTGLVLGGASAGCLDDGGFKASGCNQGTVYVSKIPKNPPPGGVDYAYTYAAGPPVDYEIKFNTEGSAGGLAKGDHKLKSGGIE